MKKILLTTALILGATAASAKTLVVQYPQEACTQILSQEYSTGGGNTVVQYLEILCVDSQGNYSGHILSMGSGAGLLGLGRFTVPGTIRYEPYNGRVLRQKRDQ